MLFRSLKAAMRGNSDESLRQAADGPVETAIAASRSYLDALSAGMIDRRTADPGPDDLDRSFASAAGNAITAWAAVQNELDRLLQRRSP